MFTTLISMSLLPPLAGKLKDVGSADVIVGVVEAKPATSSILRGASCGTSLLTVTIPVISLSTAANG